MCSKDNKFSLLVDTISQKYAQISNLTIKIVNLESNTEYKVVKNAQTKKNYYVIIYDPTHKHTIYHGECYYCNSLEDLESIVLYLLENESIFYSEPESDDVMDQEDLIYIDDQKNYKLISTLIEE